MPRPAPLVRACAAALAGLLLTAAPAVAQQPVADPGGRLVYVFSVDALDGDRVDAGRAPFLSSLLRGEGGARATYYPESRSIMVAETNPNHVAMATGAFGDRSGIPGNAFAVYGERARRDCNADEDGTTDGEVATCLQAESFFAAAKRLAPTATTTAGIFGKPKLADIFATRRVDDDAYDADFLWSPCVPGAETPYCDPGVAARPNDGYTLNDADVMSTVLETIDQGVEDDGGRKRPNLTFVNLPNVDAAGHGFGTISGAYDAAIALADNELRRFVDHQKSRGLWERTVMLVVSDHSMDTTLGRTSLSARYQLLGLGDGVIVSQNGSVDMVYLEDRTAAGRHAKLAALRREALRAPGVDEALYRQPNPADGGTDHTLDRVHPGWQIAGERTGDLLVTHKAEGAFSDPVNPLVGNHGSPYTTDNTFLVAGGDPAVRQATIAGEQGPRFDDTLTNTDSAQNVDVAPTVLGLLGLAPPADNEGRALTEAFAPGTFEAAATAGPGTAGPGTAPAPAAGTPSTAGCLVPVAFRSLSVRPDGRRGLRVRFSRALPGRVGVDVFRRSAGRSVLGHRRVARFRRTRSFRWSGRRGGDGVYLVRVRLGADTRRIVLRRVRGRFRARPASERPASCGLLQRFALSAPVFGGPRNRGIAVTFTVGARARVVAEVLRGRRVVRRLSSATRRPGRVYRLDLRPQGLRRGADHRVRLTVTAGGQRVVSTLVARRL